MRCAVMMKWKEGTVNSVERREKPGDIFATLTRTEAENCDLLERNVVLNQYLISETSITTRQAEV